MGISSEDFYKTQIIRTTSASLSAVASLIIVIMILFSPKKLTSPYRRLIFCVGLCDLIQSLGIIISPFAQPRDTPQAHWAVGNEVSCEFAGFLMTIGTVGLPMYTFALTLYFLLIVQFKFTKQQFAKKVEVWIHLGIIAWNVIGNSIQIAKNNFNVRESGICNLASYPTYCNRIEGLDCTRGIDASRDTLILAQIPIIVCFIGIILSLGTLTYYVYALESQMSHRINMNNGQSFWRRLICRTTQTVNNAGQNNNRRNELALQRNLARDSLVQSSLYVFAYLVCYLFITIAIFNELAKKSTSRWMYYLLNTTWPISGFFNIMIYTRPKVRYLKEKYPDFHKVVLFLVVVLSGGEAPPDSVMNAAIQELGIRRHHVSAADREQVALSDQAPNNHNQSTSSTLRNNENQVEDINHIEAPNDCREDEDVPPVSPNFLETFE